MPKASTQHPMEASLLLLDEHVGRVSHSLVVLPDPGTRTRARATRPQPNVTSLRTVEATEANVPPGPRRSTHFRVVPLTSVMIAYPPLRPWRFLCRCGLCTHGISVHARRWAVIGVVCLSSPRIVEIDGPGIEGPDRVG
jgi:hypothetical protein